MAKTKKKNAQATESARRPKTKPIFIEHSEVEGSGAIEQAEFWKVAIESLGSQSFECMDAAIRAVVDQVTARLVSAGKQAEVREFLFDLFDTDPDIKNELRRCLTIKGD